MTKILVSIHDLLWGAPALILILGVGLYLTFRTGFAQIRFLPRAVRRLCSSLRPGTGVQCVSSFQALCTALAATVGTGNLVGVAGALCLGGPGAIFWMWISGLLGMVTKYAEVTLAVHYRCQQGTALVGGPMYIISQGMGKRWHWLAWMYCLFGIIASFGVGNAAQINAVLTGVNAVFQNYGIAQSTMGNVMIGLILGTVIGAMLSGGAKRIGSAAERLVPLVSGAYILLSIGVLIARRDAVGEAFGCIFAGAFSPRAVTGGFLGSAFRTMMVGCSRGVFTNEAGMGTASIAHASAQVSHPAEQGLMGILEVFLDTVVICTLTALVILVSGERIPYGSDVGGELTNAAFSAVYGSSVTLFLTGALCCFAFATVLGWGLYGGRCAQFLFGERAWSWYVLAQSVMACLSCVMNTQTVWLFAETINGFMAIPNLIALAALTPELVRLTIDYKEKAGVFSAGGGNYANFHQCKPLRTLSHAEVPSSGSCRKKGRKKDLSSEHRSA